MADVTADPTGFSGNLDVGLKYGTDTYDVNVAVEPWAFGLKKDGNTLANVSYSTDTAGNTTFTVSGSGITVGGLTITNLTFSMTIPKST